MLKIRKSYFSINRLIVFASVLVLLASCKPDKIKVYSSFYQYYPLAVGNYQIYNADSIKYFNSLLSVKPPDTIRYQVMDSIQSKFIDGTGQISYRVQESVRKNSSSAWKIVRAFSRSINDRNAQEVDGNNRYIKMIFPVAQNSNWNPDLYNTTDSAHIISAKYTQVHVPYSIQPLNFDSTVVVQLQSDTNLITYIINNERYAARIGLIGIEHDSVFNIVDSINAPPAISGFRFKQTLSDYGPKK